MYDKRPLYDMTIMNELRLVDETLNTVLNTENNLLITVKYVVITLYTRTQSNQTNCSRHRFVT